MNAYDISKKGKNLADILVVNLHSKRWKLLFPLTLKCTSSTQDFRALWSLGWYLLTLKQLGHFFRNVYFISYVIHYNCGKHISKCPLQLIFNKHYGCWWPGALQSRKQQQQCWLYIHSFPAVYGLIHSNVIIVVNQPHFPPMLLDWLTDVLPAIRSYVRILLSFNNKKHINKPNTSQKEQHFLFLFC